MLGSVLQHLHNYFISETVTGTFTIEEGGINTPFLANGRCFMITGSVWNDGVYTAPASDLVDETFTGEISLLSVPNRLLDQFYGTVDAEAKTGRLCQNHLHTGSPNL